MAQIQSLLGLVERILTSIEDGALQAGFEEPIHRGSASGFACVLPGQQDPESLLLIVRLAIMRAPASDREPFLERLLELNHAFNGRAAFSVSEDGVVYLTSGRPIEDLDPGEVIDLILWTSEKADEYDDILLTEFGYKYQL
jgi:Tir chaperone family protein CesT